MAFGCKECGRGWTGMNECHCGECHQSFSTVANFDAHRKGPWEARRCLDAEEFGSLRSKNGRLLYAQAGRANGLVWVAAGPSKPLNFRAGALTVSQGDEEGGNPA